MAQQVQGPVRRPRQGGIKSVVPEFIRQPRLAVSQGIAYEGSGCALPSATRAGCYDDLYPSLPKTPTGVNQYDAIDPGIFALYAGVECYIGGDADGPSYVEQAASLLEAGEDRGVEQRLASWSIAGFGSNPMYAPNITAAIGQLENAADVSYVGAPILLMSRIAADQAVADGVLSREDGRLITPNGNYVIATSAIPVNQPFISAVGSVAVYASDVVSALALEHDENLSMAIAERVYSIAVDCDFRRAVFIGEPRPTLTLTRVTENPVSGGGDVEFLISASIPYADGTFPLLVWEHDGAIAGADSGTEQTDTTWTAGVPNGEDNPLASGMYTVYALDPQTGIKSNVETFIV